MLTLRRMHFSDITDADLMVASAGDSERYSAFEVKRYGVITHILDECGSILLLKIFA